MTIEGESFSYGNPKYRSIEMGKKYRTRDGRDVRLLCVDGPSFYPVVGFLETSLMSWSSDGRFSREQTHEHDRDLIEVSTYSDIAIDTPGWARTVKAWYPRHFAGVDASGDPMTWDNGATSHTTNDKSVWDEFTTTKPEGL